MNHKRVRCLYIEMGLQLRNKTPKRRVKFQVKAGQGMALGHRLKN